MEVTYKFYTGTAENKKEHVYTGFLYKLERRDCLEPHSLFCALYKLVLRLEDGAEVSFDNVSIKDLIFYGGETTFGLR